jgi:hypothetical protein
MKEALGARGSSYFLAACDVPFPLFAKHEISRLEPSIFRKSFLVDGRMA